MGLLKTSASLTPTWLSWKDSLLSLPVKGKHFVLWIQNSDIFEMWINATQQEKVFLDYLCFSLVDSVSKITLLFCSWPYSEPIINLSLFIVQQYWDAQYTAPYKPVIKSWKSFFLLWNYVNRPKSWKSTRQSRQQIWLRPVQVWAHFCG